MKKDVLINIKGVYWNEDDRDEVEIFTTGSYYRKNGSYYISYEESEATGFEGSRTVLRVDNDSKVTMERFGNAQAHLVVESGVRHQCHYDIGYGDLMIGVVGGKIKSDLGDKGGNLHFKYSLDVNSLMASENEMFINIKESAQ